MVNSIRYQVQNWLAERVKWVQYPGQTYMPRNRPHKVGVFKFKMPIWQRVAMIQFGLVITLLAVICLSLGLVSAYIFAKIVFIS